MKFQATVVKVCLIIMFFTLSISVDISYGYVNEGNRYGVDTSNPAYGASINPYAQDIYDGQCTDFAWGRAYDRLGWAVSPRGNACSWWDTPDAHYTQHLTSEPRANSFAIWWNPAETCVVHGETNTGHVAYVEEVSGDFVYINEANMDGPGYNGFTKKFTKSEMLTRGSFILKGYLYLDSPFSDYFYWDFDNQGTEDWNARNVYNQGIYHDPYSTVSYWQLGSSFSPHKRGIVSPVLNTISTDEFNAIEIVFGENEHEHNGVTAPCPLVVYAWVAMNLDGEIKLHGPVTIPRVNGPGTPGSQNTYRGAIPYSGQIYQVRFDFDENSPVEDAKIYINKISFVYADAEQDFFLLSGTITDPNGSNYWSVSAWETSGANLGNNVYVYTKYFEMALFPGNYDVSCSTTIDIGDNCSVYLTSPVQNLNVAQDTSINIAFPQYNYKLVHITGYVTDEYALGIQYVSVYASNSSCSSYAITDQNGFFDLSVIPGTCYISFYAPYGSSYTSVYLYDIVITDDTDLDSIVLNPFTPLIRYLVTGNFVDSSGNPAFDGYSYASISAYCYANNDSVYASTYDGYFELNLAEGSYSIYPSLSNWSSNSNTYISSTYQTITVPDTDILSILLPSYDFYIMEGKVTDINGIPQPDVNISANEHNWMCSGSDVSDSQGHYSLLLIPGQYSMTITAPPATYPPFQINNVIISGDCQRNIRLSRDYSILDEAMSELNPGLDVALDIFDIIDQADTLNYNIKVEGAKELLEIILNWAGSEMSVSVYDPEGNLYGTFGSQQPPVKVEIPNPAIGTWTCEVTAIDVPQDNYPFALVAGLTENKAPFAEASGPYSGAVNSSITLSAGASYDMDGSIVLYEWDWNNDGTYDESTTSPTISHTWTVEYNGTVGLRVTDDGGLSSTDTCSLTVSSQAQQYTLSASVINGHGTISPTSGTFNQGTVVDLTATPDSGYRVKAWSGTDNNTSTATTNTVTMNGGRTVTVEFELMPVIITHNAPATITASCSQGINPSSQSFEVWNSGGGTLSYTISADQSWLSCTPASGTSTGGHNTITINYATSGLGQGSYPATITISAPGATNTPLTIPVLLMVNAGNTPSPNPTPTPKPTPSPTPSPEELTLALTPASFSISCTKGANVVDQSFQIGSSGNDSFNYSLSADVGWITFEPSSGTWSATPSTITVHFKTESLAVGDYSANISITSIDANVTNSPQTIPVQLSVKSVEGEGNNDDGGGGGGGICFISSVKSDVSDAYGISFFVLVGIALISISRITRKLLSN